MYEKSIYDQCVLYDYLWKYVRAPITIWWNRPNERNVFYFETWKEVGGGRWEEGRGGRKVKKRVKSVTDAQWKGWSKLVRSKLSVFGMCPLSRSSGRPGLLERLGATSLKVSSGLLDTPRYTRGESLSYHNFKKKVLSWVSYTECFNNLVQRNGHTALKNNWHTFRVFWRRNWD